MPDFSTGLGISPLALVTYVHALLALAVSRRDGAVHVNDRFLEKRLRLLRPNVASGVVDLVLQGVDLLRRKPTAKVTRRRRIINRLFKTGERGNSLYERTVLMLTHDFEPVIDYIQTNSGRQTPTSVCATYFENIAGHLRCTPIQKGDDLMSSVVLFKELAMDNNIDMAARIGCLRKFIEHQFKNPQKESDAYNILSSLIHGHKAPTADSEGKQKLTAQQVKNGNAFIKEFIADFDYAAELDQCSARNILSRYGNEKSAYIKMLILRAYTEQNNEARDRLRKKNDVLRKYVDETYHIENDYIYSLDVRRFNIVPENYIEDANLFVADELREMALAS